MSKTIQLDTLFDGGCITVKDHNIGGTLLTKTAVGKFMTFTGNYEMDVCGDGESIDGVLKSIDPKGDGTLVVQVTGYAEGPLKALETITVGSSVAGYVVGSAGGEAKACQALAIVDATPDTSVNPAELLLPPRKVVSTRSGYVTIDFGAKCI